MEATLKIAKKMEKMIKTNEVNNEALLRYLDYLKDVDMTLDILTKSGIGLVINQLRRLTDDPEVSRAGKSLIKEWRSLVPTSTGSPDSPAETQVSESLKRKKDWEDDSVSSAKTSKVENSSLSSAKASKVENSSLSSAKTSKVENSSLSSKPSETSKTSTPSNGGDTVETHNLFAFQKKNDTKDSVRLKSREMLKKALASGDIPDGAYDTDYLAVEIEVAIHKEFKDTDTKYKNRLRSRIMNLNDKSNPQLRLNVLLGHVRADHFAKMTAEEMASDEMKKLRDEMTKQAIQDHQLAVSAGTETSLIKCGKCGGSKCTYNQLQTRSSDEPMTTFVYCNTCGHRFKFN